MRTSPRPDGRSVYGSSGHDPKEARSEIDVRGKTFPICSPIRSACMDSSTMTLSLVAVVTDVQQSVVVGALDMAVWDAVAEVEEQPLHPLLADIPHGGHQLSLSIAAGPGLGGNESYPGLFQPFGGFPDGLEVEDGHVTVPDLPGIGFEGTADLIREMRALRD